MIETQRKRRGHAFLPPQRVLDKIPGLYATENTPAEDKIVWLHYFCASGDWWITELDRENDLAFGYVKLASYPEGAEWGYISLTELEEVNAHHGLVIVERDCFWTEKRFGDVFALKGRL